MDNQTLQVKFLSQLKESKQTIAIYLANGVRLRGRIEDFDDYALLIVEDKPLLVYKRAIATIMAL